MTLIDMIQQQVKKARRVAATVSLLHVLGLLSSIHAIIGTRTEQGSVVWAVSLNTFPHVTGPAY